MVVTSSRSDTGRRRRRTTNSLHQLSPEFSFSRPVMEPTPSQQGKSWASIIAKMIWSRFNCSRTTLLGAQYIIAEQDSGPPTPSQCNQFGPSQLHWQMIESEPFGVFCIKFRELHIDSPLQGYPNSTCLPIMSFGTMHLAPGNSGARGPAPGPWFRQLRPKYSAM